MADLKNTTKSHPLPTAPLTPTPSTLPSIPAVALGTWNSRPGAAVAEAVAHALRLGYRHIDTAAAYGNEAEVGEGIRLSGVPREEIWVTTKLDNAWHTRAEEALAGSLERLGTGWVDLWLMHWPCAVDPADKKRAVEGWTVEDTWREMRRVAREKGGVRFVGVSNFGVGGLKKLGEGGEMLPAVNQVELHPGNPSPKLVEYCKAQGIHVSAYSPLGSTESPLKGNETLRAVAEAHGKSPSQVLLMWGLQKGWSILPKSVTPERIEENFDLDGWCLTDEEMARIDAIPDRFKVCGDSWLPVKVFFGDGN